MIVPFQKRVELDGFFFFKGSLSLAFKPYQIFSFPLNNRKKKESLKILLSSSYEQKYSN